MIHVKFKYKDKWTESKWSEQECIVNSVQECKELYGLGIDCEYKIISITKL